MNRWAGGSRRIASNGGVEGEPSSFCAPSHNELAATREREHRVRQAAVQREMKRRERQLVKGMRKKIQAQMTDTANLPKNLCAMPPELLQRIFGCSGAPRPFEKQSMPAARSRKALLLR